MAAIKARMLMCGEVELQGEEWENIIVLEATDKDWRIEGGVHVVIPLAELEKLSSSASHGNLNHSDAPDMCAKIAGIIQGWTKDKEA